MKMPDGSSEAPSSDTNENAPDLHMVADALAACVREELEPDKPVEVPGLGTFHIEHRSSQIREQQGNRSITPPREVVVFEPFVS